MLSLYGFTPVLRISLRSILRPTRSYEPRFHPRLERDWFNYFDRNSIRIDRQHRLSNVELTRKLTVDTRKRYLSSFYLITLLGDRNEESLFHRGFFHLLDFPTIPIKWYFPKIVTDTFFRKRRTKKTDVPDKNHEIVSLFVSTENIFE